MSNDNIPATITFPKGRVGYYDPKNGAPIRLKDGVEYTVRGSTTINHYNDYGYMVYTYLKVQREGGNEVFVPWGNPEAVQC